MNKYNEEIIIKKYIELYNKIGKTPSIKDIEKEKNINDDFPSYHTIIRYFKSLKNLWKICNIPYNLRKNNFERISDLRLFLRTAIKPWVEDSKLNCNNKCIISGKEADVVHHSYPFYKIINETLNELGLPKKKHTYDYTNKELESIGIKCLELHYEYGLGVCFKKYYHNEFHKIYGRDTTRENIEEYILNIKENANINKEHEVNEKEYANVFISKNELIEILKLENLKDHEKLVLFTLLIQKKKYSNKDEFFYCSQDYISKHTNIKERTIRDMIKKLYNKGCIDKIREKYNYTGKNLPNKYKILVNFKLEGDLYEIKTDNYLLEYGNFITTSLTKQEKKQYITRGQREKYFKEKYHLKPLN